MPKVEVKCDALKREAQDIKEITRKLDYNAEQILAVSRILGSMNSAGYGIITTRLRTCVNKMKTDGNSISDLSKVLSEIGEEYYRTENVRILGKKIPHGSHHKPGNYKPGQGGTGSWGHPSSGFPNINDDVGVLCPDLPEVDKGESINPPDDNDTMSGASGEYEWRGSMSQYGSKPYDYSDDWNSVHAEMAGFHAEGEVKGEYDLSPGNAYASLGAEGSVSLMGHLAAEANALNGLINLDLGADIGYVEGETNANVGVARDGLPILSAGAGAAVAAGVAKGEAALTIGTENYNHHLAAEGSLLSAEAEAKADAELGAYENDDGETVYGVKAEAGAIAGAYLAEGEVTGGITLFGIDIEATIGGSVGPSAGVEGNAELSTGGIKIGGKLAAGLLGGEVDLEVDWSDFQIFDEDELEKFEWLDYIF